MLTVAVTWSSFDNNAIPYVLLVLWMALCFHIIEPMEHNENRRYVSSSTPVGGSRVKLLSTIAGLFIVALKLQRYSYKVCFCFLSVVYKDVFIQKASVK